MGIEEMPQCGVPSNEDELIKRAASSTLFQQPKQSFDRNIHHLVGSFFAGRAMNDVSDSLHCGAHRFAISDVSLYDLDPLMWLGNPIVAEGANGNVFVTGRVKDPVNEMSAYLACCPGYKYLFHSWFGAVQSRDGYFGQRYWL